MKFSLVIPLAPYRNAEILESIEKLNYPKEEFEVVVIKGPNSPKNKNDGFEKSKGEIIIFLDDDAVIKEDYLKNVENFFEKHSNVDIVGGPQLTPLDDKGFAKISGYALGSKFGAYKVAERYICGEKNCDADETCITSASLICKRHVMRKIKFDINLWPGEDPKFISDAKKNGFIVAYSPEIVIYHRRRPTISGMAKQIFCYGKVRPAKEKFVETLKMPFFLVPSLFVIYLFLILIDLTIKPKITGNVINAAGIQTSVNFLLIIPLLIYFLLTILFSIYDSAKNKDMKAFFVLPFIYPLIHVSYGIGMIWGYLKKLK